MNSLSSTHSKGSQLPVTPRNPTASYTLRDLYLYAYTYVETHIQVHIIKNKIKILMKREGDIMVETFYWD